jgi:hypothetical protein
MRTIRFGNEAGRISIGNDRGGGQGNIQAYSRKKVHAKRSGKAAAGKTRRGGTAERQHWPYWIE